MRTETNFSNKSIFQFSLFNFHFDEKELIVFMNKLLKTGFTVLTLALVFSVFSVTETKAQGILNDILKRMDTHYGALRNVQADIKRVKTDNLLGESDEQSGNLVMMPGSGKNFSLRLNWTKPRDEQLAVVNGLYVMYIPARKLAYTGSSSSKNVSDKGGNVLQVMSMSRAELKANYDIQYISQEQVSGGIQTARLKLTPKTKAKFKYAELWVDADGMPLQAKIVASNNDTDTILLSSIRKNNNIDGSLFAISPPKGTKIEKM